MTYWPPRQRIFVRRLKSSRRRSFGLYHLRFCLGGPRLPKGRGNPANFCASCGGASNREEQNPATNDLHRDYFEGISIHSSSVARKQSKKLKKTKHVRLRDAEDQRTMNRTKLAAQRQVLSGKQFSKMMRCSPGILAMFAVVKEVDDV